MIQLINGNATKIPLADNSVHTVMTSPPYWGLRVYSGEQNQIWGGNPNCDHRWEWSTKKGISGGKAANREVKGAENFQIVPDTKSGTCSRCHAWYGALGSEPTPEMFVANIVTIFREVKRVLHPSGILWLNVGDSYNGSGGAGGDYNKNGIREGQPRYSGRSAATLKPKDLCGIPWRVALALQQDGWYWRSWMPWIKRNGLPNTGPDRPDNLCEVIHMFTKNRNPYFDKEAVRIPAIYGYDDRGSRKDRRRELKQAGDKKMNAMDHSTGGTRNWRTSDAFMDSIEALLDGAQGMLVQGEPLAMVVNTSGFKGEHFAAFPPKLVQPCIKAATSEWGVCPKCGEPWIRMVEKTHQKRTDLPKDDPRYRPNEYNGSYGEINGKADAAYYESRTLGWKPGCKCNAVPVPATVFDPFVGSGTVLQVARELGRNGVGLDLSFPYIVGTAKPRLGLDKLEAWTLGQPKFAEPIRADWFGHK